MFKLYNLFRDNLKMEIYLFKDQIQVSWKKTCHFQQYFSFICGGQQWIAGIHLNTFESQKLNNIYMGRFGQIMIYFGKSGAVLVGGVLVVGGRVDMYSSPPPPLFFQYTK